MRGTGHLRHGIAEVALCTVSVMTVVALLRIFDYGAWLWVLVAQAIVAHAVAAATRRARWPVAPSLGSVLLAGAVTVTIVYAGASPTALARSVGDSFADFGNIKAPVPAEAGFLIACAAAVWIIAALADWWAFRLRATVESTIPAGALFVIATILGADRHRALFAGLFVAAVLVHVLIARTARTDQGQRWIGAAARTGSRALLKLGSTLVAIVAVFAVVAGPRLPSATSEGAVDLRNLDGDAPGPRVTVSPLVDIRKQLVQQSDVVVFQVRSPIDAYWRLTSLDRFDGRIWASDGSFGDGDGELDAGVPVDAERTVIEQQIRILALRQLWVPAAYEPRRVSDADAELRYDESSGTLIVGHEMNTSDGISYRVTSAQPVLDPARLTTASAAVPADIADRYLDLPDAFPDEIATLARQVTDGADSVYAKALELQSFFRSEFDYSLEVDDSHSVDAMVHFLFESRSGYCEQFAGTYAAMARSLGIPARVAVGFTPGERTSADPDVLNVRGVNAHAWPEIYLGEFGWVAFEPTPGRGQPGAEPYTGVPAQQATPVASPQTTAAAPPSTVPSELTTPPSTAPSTPSTTATPTPDTSTSSSSPWPGRLALAALVVVTLVAAYVAAVWLFDLVGQRRRRARATTEEARIAAAWDDALGAVADAGVHAAAGETQTETARRVEARLPEVAEPFAELAAAVELTTFSPRPPVDGDGLRAFELADSVRVHLDATQNLRTRLRRKYDPRSRLGR